MRGVAAAILLIALSVPWTAFDTASAQQKPQPIPPVQSPGQQLGTGPTSPGFVDKETVYEELNLFDEAFERVKRDAVDPVLSTKLVDAAIGGMLTGLDPHAAYIDPTAYKALKGASAALPDTVGVVVSFADGQLRVIAPRDGSPAAKAGLKPGDLIFTIDKEPTFAMTLPQAEARLAGPAGSTVRLTVLRPGSSKPLHIALTRTAYQLRTVSARVEDGDIGYLRLAGFDAQTVADLTAALQGLRRQTGDKLIGLILDLRDNPGGNFTDAVKTADAFLDGGTVAIIKGRHPADGKRIAVTPGDIAKGLPIVALINGGTAREAELVVAALHDNHRAVLIGTRTYGDSAIESLIPLDSGGAIRLTTARFLTPNGTVIAGKGITPDLTIKSVKVAKIASNIETLHEVDLPGALKNPDAAATKLPAGVPPGASAAPAPHTPVAAAGARKDAQLTEAVDVLRGLAVYHRHASG